jgi:hypothetical protein
MASYPLTTDGTDQSGHGFDLTLSNVLFSTVGSGENIRLAASFDGQSSYAIVSQALIAGQTNWTWSAWLFSPPGAITAKPEAQSIYMEGNQGGEDFDLIIITNVTMGIMAWNLQFPGYWVNTSVPYVLTNGWNHLALALDNGALGSGTLSIYFNGVLTNMAVLQSVVLAALHGA